MNECIMVKKVKNQTETLRQRVERQILSQQAMIFLVVELFGEEGHFPCFSVFKFLLNIPNVLPFVENCRSRSVGAYYRHNKRLCEINQSSLLDKACRFLFVDCQPVS